jgi:hypothetical protein
MGQRPADTVRGPRDDGALSGHVRIRDWSVTGRARLGVACATPERGRGPVGVAMVVVRVIRERAETDAR